MPSLDSPSGCPDRGTLEAFQLGLLSEAGLEGLAEHLSACPQCGSALEEVQRRLQESDSLLARLRACFEPRTHLQESGCAALEAAARAIPLTGSGGAVTLAESEQAHASQTSAATGTAITAAPMPETVGPYLLLGRLGQGGMGVVYKARQRPLGRLVALKMILAGAHAAPHAQARFRIEGEAIARLHHPHVVQIYEFGAHDGLPYYSMEYVSGGSLASRLQDGPLPPRQAAALVQKLAAAVEAAHQVHVLHRDLKPANILLTADGEPKIADFGLAKLLDEEDGQTCSDMVLGTPNYMAPEQAEARSADIGPATDVHALGTILYHALTGRPPFKAASKQETLRQVVRSAPVPPRRLRREVPRALEAVCLKCLEKTPHRRYASAQALADDLGRFLRGEPTMARPPRWPARLGRWARRYAVALSLAVALGTALAVLYLRDPQRQVEQVARTLARGEPITLVGETGPPRWYHLRTGQASTQVSPAPDGAFGVHTWGACLLELVPDPRCDRFRFRAQVRHQASERPNGEVGLYFGDYTYPERTAETHLFLRLTLDDIRSPKEQWQRLPKQTQALVKPPEFNHFDLAVSYGPNGAGPVAGDPGWKIAGTAFRPALDGQTWRDLEVVVTPERVQTFWEGKPTAAVEAARLASKLEALRAQVSPAPAPAPPASTAVPLYHPRGALGLYLQRGSASFRNVTVTPLPRPTLAQENPTHATEIQGK